jgi:hypothetical protein
MQIEGIGSMVSPWSSGRRCSDAKMAGVLSVEHLSRGVITSNGWLITTMLVVLASTRVGSAYVVSFAISATWAWVVFMMSRKCFVQRRIIWNPGSHEDLWTDRGPQ